MNRKPSPSPATSPGSGRARRPDLLLPGAFFLAALALRLALRTHESLWLDEANSVLIAGRSAGDIFRALRLDGNPPLYYLLLHAWTSAFGSGESALRLFCAILGSLLPPALYLAARTLLPRRSAWIPALLALAWPLSVFYSQQVRMYGLLPAVSALFLAALFHAATGPTDQKRWWRPWAWVAAAGCVLVYLHNYGIFVVLSAPLVWWLLGQRNRTAVLGLAGALGLIFVLYLPWLPVLLHQAGSDVGAWIAAAFRADAPLRSLGLFGTRGTLLAAGAISTEAPPAGLPSLIWLSLVLAGSAFFTLRDRSRRNPALACLAALFVPLLLPYLASLIARPIYWVGRYEVVAYPGFALFTGLGAEAWLAGTARSGRKALSMIPRAVTALACLAYLLPAGIVLARYHDLPAERTEDRIVGSLSRRLAPGDAIIFTGLGRAPVEYYLARQGYEGRLRLLTYPKSTEEHPGWFDFAAARAHPSAMDQEARDIAAGLAGFPGKVFLIDNAAFPELRDLQEPLRRWLGQLSAGHQVLIRTGPHPDRNPIYEVSVYSFRPSPP